MKRALKLLFLVCALSAIESTPLFAGDCTMNWSGGSKTPFGNVIFAVSWTDYRYEDNASGCESSMYGLFWDNTRWICADHPASDYWESSGYVYFDGSPVGSPSANAGFCARDFGLNGYNVLTAGQALNPGGSLGAPGGQYTLSYQTDGNLVMYHGGTPVWAANCWSTCVDGFYPPGQAIMQSDGNFIVFNSSSAAVWMSATSGSGAYLAVRDDGEVVVYSAYGASLWSSIHGHG